MVEKEKDQYMIDIVSALAERTVKRLWIALILTIVLLVGSNAWWVWRESQFTDESWTYEAEQDTDGGGYSRTDMMDYPDDPMRRDGRSMPYRPMDQQ